jgi:hypothetical protein
VRELETPISRIFETRGGDTATTSGTASSESRQVGLNTTVNVAVETGTGVGENTVANSSVVGEVCTPMFSETTDSSTAAGEEGTRVYTQSENFG